MDFSHAITYAVFQVMVGLFMASPLAKTTAEGDYISIPTKDMVRLLEQPRTAGIRYYFICTPNKKISAVIYALDSAGQENNSFIINARSDREAERGIRAYADKKLVDKTGMIFGSIGVASENGKIVYTKGKEELMQLAQSAKEIRAFYGLKESADKKQHLILCFSAADAAGAVLQRSAVGTATTLDAAFECPPFCKAP